MQILRVLMGLLVLFSASVQAADGNGELYGAVAPADSGFVRVLNLSDAPAEVQLSEKKNSQTVSAGNLGGFQFSSPGKKTLTVNGISTSFDLETRLAVTAVFDGATLTVIRDKVPQDARKAYVSFLNLTDQAVSLKTQDGKHVLVKELAKGEHGSRKVNEIKIKFAVYAGDTKLQEYEDTFLRKGRSYTFAVVPEAPGYRLLSLADTVEAIE